MVTILTPRTCSQVANPGKTTFWAIETHEGQNYTVWDKGIAEEIEANFGVPLGCQVKIVGSHHNIRGIYPAGTPQVAQAPALIPGAQRPAPVQAQPVQPVQQAPQPMAATGMTKKDKSILSQTILKCASWVMAGIGPSAESDFAKELNAVCEDLVAQYHANVLKF